MKHWVYSPTPDGPAETLARQSSIPVPLARVLVTRGISSAESLDRFLSPRLSDAADPFVLPNMDVAVTRIWEAIRKNQPIIVYGDYDVDGVTSAALMSLVLGDLGARVSRYLPSRMEEGYGLNPDAVERCIAEARPGLIVTTDCGSGAREAVAKARALGVDVVVTDHHELSGPPVDAFAVVNPKLGHDPSARLLSGVGVAFKVCHALVKRGREKRFKAVEQVDLRQYLDLVALGTVADVVPLLHENRILVKHGLVQLNRRDRVGLMALADVAGAKGELGTYHVGFVLGPRMNAAGRLGNAEEALELLLTNDRERAWGLARRLDDANTERRRIEAAIVEAAIRQVEASHDHEEHAGIVVGEAGWHIGVVGIVASRLVTRYGKPVVVIGFDEHGNGRGSCRGIEGVDLLAELKRCAHHLSRFGGHEMAAGLEISRDHFEDFRKAFREACAETLKGGPRTRSLPIDGWVTLTDVLDKTFMDLTTRMEPFGEGNREPVWACRQVEVIGKPRLVGEKHLKFRVGVGGDSCEAIGFNMADRLDNFPEGAIDVAFTLRNNTYLGRTSPQLHLQDFRPTAL